MVRFRGDDVQLRIGSEDKHDAFLARHEQFFSRVDNLMTAENAAFDRNLSAKGMLDPTVFYLGIRAVEDFNAIVLLAANGQAHCANALVRGMFERVVTAAYQSDHPEEVQDFVDFDHVQKFRAAQAIDQSIGLNETEKVNLRQLRERYEEVKSRFLVDECKKCKTTRVGPSWSKLNFVAMTKKALPLDQLVAFGYYIPLSQAHSTWESINSLLRSEDSDLIFRKDYSKECDIIFRLTHLLLLHVFRTQAKHFKIPAIEKAAAVLNSDYIAIYPEASSEVPE